MSVDTSPGQRGEPTPTSPELRPSFIQRAITALTHVEWGVVLLVAFVMASGWSSLLIISLLPGNEFFQILIGIIPVMAGLYLGNRVKGNHMANGIVLGVSGFFIGLAIVWGYGTLLSLGVPVPQLRLVDEAGQIFEITNAGPLIFHYLVYSLFLIPFPAFGTVMAGRTQERNVEMRREVEERGGRLERPSVVRTLEDLRGLSLPQFGSYVSNLYKKKGFNFKDYRFIDKDRHLDIEMEYSGEIYLLRLSVADKVRSGTVESLIQDMRRREIAKGIVVTSTEFTPDTIKAATHKRNIITIDGQTLFDMAEA